MLVAICVAGGLLAAASAQTAGGSAVHHAPGKVTAPFSEPAPGSEAPVLAHAPTEWTTMTTNYMRHDPGDPQREAMELERNASDWRNLDKLISEEKRSACEAAHHCDCNVPSKPCPCCGGSSTTEVPLTEAEIETPVEVGMPEHNNVADPVMDLAAHETALHHTTEALAGSDEAAQPDATDAEAMESETSGHEVTAHDVHQQTRAHLRSALESYEAAHLTLQSHLAHVEEGLRQHYMKKVEKARKRLGKAMARLASSKTAAATYEKLLGEHNQVAAAPEKAETAANITPPERVSVSENSAPVAEEQASNEAAEEQEAEDDQDTDESDEDDVVAAPRAAPRASDD